MTSGPDQADATPAPRRRDRAAPRTRALRHQMFRLLIGAVLVPALALVLVQTYFEYQRVEQEQKDRLRLAVRLTATAIDQFVETHASAVALAAKQAASRGEPPDLAALRGSFPLILTALATDSTGRIAAIEPANSAAAAERPSVADRDYFSVPARELRPYVSDAFRGRGFGTDALVAVSAPLIVEGAFAGIVEGSIRVDAFTALRSSALRARGQEMLVVDRSGNVIHASAGLPLEFLQSVGDSAFLQGQEDPDGISPVMIDRTTSPDGSAWVAWSELRSGWRVAIFEPRRAALAGVWRHAAQAAAAVLLMALLVLVIANAQIKRLARAVGITLESLRAIAAGERAPDSSIHGVPPELKSVTLQVVRLAEQFRSANAGLAGALQAQQRLAADLQAANDRLEDTVRLRTAELESANADLERLSRTDPLTGALNLRGLGASHASVTGRHGRLASRVAVIAFDVDFFKAYNDHYGHPAGDQVLRRVAATSLAALRGEDDRVARVGGEEFVVLLPGADAEVAGQIAERIRADLYHLGIPHVGGCDSRVTISLGIAVGEPGDAIDDVLRVADAALYRSKGAGRNRVSR